MNRTLHCLLVATAVALAGCSLMPERVAPGASRADIEAQLGRPTLVHTLPDGTRLQYSGQPSGPWVHNLDLGADGRLVRNEQAMDAGWLLQHVQIGRWTREDVLRGLGRPAIVELWRASRAKSGPTATWKRRARARRMCTWTLQAWCDS